MDVVSRRFGPAGVVSKADLRRIAGRADLAKTS